MIWLMSALMSLVALFSQHGAEARTVMHCTAILLMALAIVNDTVRGAR